MRCPPPQARHLALAPDPTWLRTKGVSTNGAAAKIMNFDRMGKRYALTLFADPICPFLTGPYLRGTKGVPRKGV